MKTIDASGMYYADLNKSIRESIKSGEAYEFLLKNINGQRYIGDGLTGDNRITIEGTPGNDLAAYMNGYEIVVKGNAQDAVANTMNTGRIIVHGNAGDTLGYAMRGGEVFIKENVGYRVGIHMKEYQDKVPVIVVGGKAGDFLGEYMAGGRILLLGMNLRDGEEIVGNYCGTGMHGGVMYVRGEVAEHKLGKEVRVEELNEQDKEFVSSYVMKYVEYFGFSYDFIMNKKFTKLYPFNKRPYGNLYAY